MKKTSHHIVVTLLGLLFALLSASLQAESALLWRVETDKGAVSHLFGTIHSEDPRVISLPEAVEQAFSGADTLMLEMELTPEVQMKMAQAIMLPPAQQLSDLVPSELYRDALSAMKQRGYPQELTARLRPWAVILTLSMPQPKSGEFLDKVLYDRALAAGKQIDGLETVEEQLDLFRNLTLEDQHILLRQTLDGYPELDAMMEAITEVWLARDLDGLAKLQQENMEGLPATLQERFERQLVDNRNRRMAERALPNLKQGKTFIAIGALHLTGETGLVALLREQGMKVTPVY